MNRLLPCCLLASACWSFTAPDELAYSCLDDGDCVAGYRCREGVCDAGEPSRLEHETCSDCAIATCPEGMVRIGTGATCIDAYEATAQDHPECDSATAFATEIYDLPDGFPIDVDPNSEHDVCPFGCAPQTEPVYACSRPGRLPTRLVTWNQASRACANAGKRLCRRDEWQAACGGPQLRAFPSVASASSTACPNEASPTGSRAACEGFYGGIFDMIGNTMECADLQVAPVPRPAGPPVRQLVAPPQPIG